MRFARVRIKDEVEYAMVDGDAVRVVEGTPFGEYTLTDRVVPLELVKLLAPVEPSKVVAVGLNYHDHAEELGMPIPEDPILFLKPPTSVIGPGDAIVYPKMSERVDYEAELAIVVGKPAASIFPEEAPHFILGYTCANDVTARDLQNKDVQWTRAKSFDTFSPLGPWIETDLDPLDLRVEAILNGEVKQSSTTAYQIFNANHLVAFISNVMTLLPGDVILTGTPFGVGPMEPGDEIEIRVEGIGSLVNKVVRI